jgi:membrane fusion protein (multidrug efflux system)
MATPPPGTPASPTKQDHDSLLIRMLYDEQTRLRAEMDELRRKQEQGESGSEEKKEEDKEQQDGEQEKEGGEEQDKDGADKKSGDKKDGKEQKPPLLDRIRAWTKVHPVGTVLIVVGFIVLVIAAILLWMYLESYENTDDAFVDGHTDPISARISGIVVGSYVENTYHVKKGEVLIQLDPNDYQIALEQARSNLAQAGAGVRAQTPNVPITQTSQSTEVANAEASVTSAAATVSVAEQRYQSSLSDLEQAKVNQANAARKEQRYRGLVAKEEVSREMYDTWATQAAAAAANVASHQKVADAAAKEVTSSQATLNQARQRLLEFSRNQPRQVAIQRETLAMRNANVLTAQAQVDQARLNLQYTKIYAPADGIVGDKSVQMGTQVAPGEEMLAVTETEDIWVTANFKETQIRKMRPGQSVTIHVDALSQNFQGYVEALSGASGSVYSLLPPENATGNYVKVVQRLPVRIRFNRGQPGA